jgi:hypothetical protein
MSGTNHDRRLYEVVRVDGATNSITEWMHVPASSRDEALAAARSEGWRASETRARVVRVAGRHAIHAPE